MFDTEAPELATLSARVLDLLHEIDRRKAELVQVVGEWDAAEEWKHDGALSGASWLAHRGPLTRDDALRLVHTGRHAQTHERTRTALAAGEISVAHAGSMAAAAFRREEVFVEEEPELLELASVQQPEQFLSTMRQWRNRADEQLARSNSLNASERCYLRGKPTSGSMIKVNGLFEADGWATILAALQPLARPDAVPSTSPRSGGRRLADALVELAAQSLGGETGSGRVRFAADIVIDYETLMRMANGDLLARICDIEGLGPVPLSMVERLLCDCSVGRVLMRGQSEVLDLGRRTDVPSPAQRRALARRDKHCRFPGCDRPVRWTDAHHIVHWIRGGPTDLDNLVLLCRRHHTACHEGGWNLVRSADGSISAERGRGRAPPRSKAA
ncbi:MAG: DUF222 domain-containing protein [Acidimicrobiia bacterium]